MSDGHWHVRGTSFILSAERLTALAFWNSSETVPSASTPNSSSDIKVETSGTAVSFLGNGPTSDLYGIPRLGFDGRLPNGLTLGGSLSYIVNSSKSDQTVGSATTTRDNPTVAAFLVAGRIGVLFEASDAVSIWLRGGATRVSLATDANLIVSGTTVSSSETVTNYAVNLEPQLVVTPVAHVGITFGLNLDIGVSGSDKTILQLPQNSGFGSSSSQTTEQDFTASSYGASAGLIAMF